MRKDASTAKSGKTTRPFAILSVVFLVLGILLDVIAPRFESVLTVAMRGSSVDAVSHENALETGYALCQEAEEEGAVLLRNENHTLPIATSPNAKTRVNLFGVRSAHLVLNSAGSAAGSNAEAVNLKDALEQANFEVNENLWTMLAGVAVKDNTSVNEGGTSVAVNELAVSEYVGNCSLESALAYSEYAIVTFSRLGGEGADQTRSGMGENNDQSYLELTTNEKSLIRALKETGFKVIVLINSSYAMELGPLEEYNVDAALWIGGPGVKGALAVGRILSGEVNPSGRLVDTYAYDLTTASTFITSDNYSVLDESGSAIGGYTYYSEGIYYGYKWYETADAEGFWDTEFASEKWGIQNGYSDVVQYPFGYGLSYTSFTQKFADTPVFDEASGTITFQIAVTNTGDTAGKEVVQLYFESPYTNGGVEKSKVLLAAFGKTELLDPGTSQTVALTVAVSDLASYDSIAANGMGAYVLDAGSYTFYLASGESGAHCWENAQDSYTQTLSAVEYSGDNARPSDLIAACNQLKEAAVCNGETIMILSRAEQFANAEQSVFSPMNDITVKEGSPLYEALVTNQSKAGEYQGEILADLSVGQAGKLKLKDLIGADFEDERWDSLINQMSVEDMITLCGTGGWSTAAIASIGKEATTDIDGPYGLSSLIKNTLGVDVNCVSYCTEVVMASTWNTELVERIGAAVAAEANATNTSGWYAPGANTHRTPFGGRNPEYYSEDAVLAGRMCAAETNGALSGGLYVYAKHFAFNDTEANRTAKQNCYLDEQTAREVYLKPFEIAVKNDSYDEEGNQLTYGLTGLMSSYMWIEENWDGANYGLMTTILRDEWGFTGMVVTDNAALVNTWITLNKAVYGGTDLMLVYNTAKMSSTASGSDSGISALKKSSKNILWTIADAASRRNTQASGGFDWWALAFTSLNVVFFGGAVVFAAVYVMNIKKRKAVNIRNRME